MKKSTKKAFGMVLVLGIELVVYTIAALIVGGLIADAFNSKFWPIVIACFASFGLWVYRVFKVNQFYLKDR